MGQPGQEKVPPDGPLAERALNRRLGVDKNSAGGRSASLARDSMQEVQLSPIERAKGSTAPASLETSVVSPDSSTGRLQQALDVFLWCATAAVALMVVYLIYRSFQIFGIVA